ncbi:MAG: hypothetical protein KGI50_08040 [Patescibacteria group bacterium]|nr:hypothetical protein [Patescibacteria group bacterium]
MTPAPLGVSDEEFQIEVTEEYLSEVYDYELRQPVDLTIEFFEPVILTIHGPLVR